MMREWKVSKPSGSILYIYEYSPKTRLVLYSFEREWFLTATDGPTGMDMRTTDLEEAKAKAILIAAATKS